MKDKPIGNIELWTEYKSEKNEVKKLELRNKIIEEYYSLVKQIAYRLAVKLNWKVQPDELTSFGIDGLYVAIKRFDISRNIDFKTYASIRIKGSMIDCIRKEDKIPRSVRINYNKFEKTKSKLELKEGRKVLDVEVIKEMGISEDEYFKHIKKYTPASFLSIDSLGGSINEEDFKQDFNSNLIDKSVGSPDININKKEFFNKLLGKHFTQMERKIIYLYYYENLTMEMIANQFNMSESRISQIHKLLIPRLKNKIFRNPNYFKNYINEFVSGFKNDFFK